MKQRKFIRRLQLNRCTISRLDRKETKRVVGGKTDYSLCETNCGWTDCGIACPCVEPYTY